MKSLKKIIAVDFDGTLCENSYPNIGKPKDKVIEFVKKLAESCIIVLWSCRRGVFLDDAVAWCREHGIRLDYINENSTHIIARFNGDCRKIYADLYIDDRAIGIEEIEQWKQQN